ncbi:MAG: PAS domain S-box protein, partial [Candidatus Binatia bacterium]
MTSSRRLPDRPASPPEGARPSQAGGFTSAIQDFSDLFEDANDIIVVNDRDGRLVAGNRAAREFGGYTPEDVERGIYLRDVLPSPDYEAALLLTQRALDGLPVPEVYERTVVWRDGSRRVLQLRSNVLRRSGSAPLLQTIGRDITEQKEAAAFQNSLLQVSEALLTAQSVDELGRVICEQARRVLDVDGAYLWLRRGDALVGTAAAGTGAHPVCGRRR